MRMMIARNLISRNPLKELESTGKFDENGEAIWRAKTEKVRPGTVFAPADEEELNFLLELNAARPLTASEEALFSNGRTSGFPIDAA